MDNNAFNNLASERCQDKRKQAKKSTGWEEGEVIRQKHKC